MSIQAVAWVLEHSKAELADRLVLIAIANHCDARGHNAWPSAKHIAREARVTRRTVQRAIQSLEKLGELIVERRPGRPSNFQLPLGRVGQDVPPRGRQDVPRKGAAGCPTGGTDRPTTWDRMSPEPLRTVNEPSRARTRARTRDLTDDERAVGLENVRRIRRRRSP